MGLVIAADLQLIPDAVEPGERFVVRVVPAANRDVAEVRASVLGNPVKFYPRAHTWKGLAAINAGAQVKDTPVYVKVFYKDGTSFQDIVTVGIRPKRFPTQNIRMSSSKTGLMDPGLLRQEREQLYSHLANSQPEPLWNGAFIAPCTGRNVSSFGRRRYVNGAWWGQHSGADIACATGTPAKADNAGIIVLAETLQMRGNTIVIDHGFNVFSLYNHLSSIHVEIGDSVQKEEVVGKAGATGFVTGPHLHWEIRIGTIPVNPWTWTQGELVL